MQRELVIVAVAAPPQFVEVVAVVRDQPAHHVHVAEAPFQLSFGCFQVALRRFDIFLGNAHFGGHCADFLVILFLRLRQLRGQLLVGALLLFADRFGAALGLRQLGLRQADSLRRDFHLAFQVRDACIRLVELRGQDLVLFLLLRQVLADLRLRAVAGDAQHGDPGHHENQQNRNPSRRARGLVAIRFLRRRYVWRNAHSPSSEVDATPASSVVLKLSPAFAHLSTAPPFLQLVAARRPQRTWAKREIRPECSSPAGLVANLQTRSSRFPRVIPSVERDLPYLRPRLDFMLISGQRAKITALEAISKRKVTTISRPRNNE